MAFVLGVECVRYLERLPQTALREQALLLRKREMEEHTPSPRLAPAARPCWREDGGDPSPRNLVRTTQLLWLCFVTVKKKVGGLGKRLSGLRT